MLFAEDCLNGETPGDGARLALGPYLLMGFALENSAKSELRKGHCYQPCEEAGQGSCRLIVCCRRQAMKLVITSFWLPSREIKLSDSLPFPESLSGPHSQALHKRSEYSNSSAYCAPCAILQLCRNHFGRSQQSGSIRHAQHRRPQSTPERQVLSLACRCLDISASLTSSHQ